MFGTRDEVEPVSYLIGTATGCCAWAETSCASVKVAGTRVIHVRLVLASLCRFRRYRERCRRQDTLGCR